MLNAGRAKFLELAEGIIEEIEKFMHEQSKVSASTWQSASFICFCIKIKLSRKTIKCTSRVFIIVVACKI